MVRIVLLAVLAAGCVTKATHRKALARVTALEAQVAERDRKIADLDGQLKTARGEVDTLATGKSETEAQLAQVKTEKEATEAELAEVRAMREADQKRLAAFQDLQQRFKGMVDSGDLEVGFRNGQMRLKLPSGVLFPSGEAALSEPGKKTLTAVTKLLIELKGRRFLVAGHTDNVPIKTAAFANNWYLSTARAVSVVEFMVSQGLSADQLAAAGYADKDPVSNNKTGPGRKKNRRIEIILVPDLSELPKLAKEPQ